MIFIICFLIYKLRENPKNSFRAIIGLARGMSLINDDWTLGLISKDSGGTSNKIAVSNNAAIFTPSLPQSPNWFEAQILCATSFWTKKCISSIPSKKLISLIIILFFASYVFAGGFEEDPGPEELVSESNNSTSNTDSLSIESETSLEEEEVLETGTASFTDSEGNIVTWSQGLVTTGGDDKKYVVWGN